MLNLFRRHIQSCSQKAQGRQALKCACPIWFDWRIGGERLRRPTGTRDWRLAQQRARDWEAKGFQDGGKTTTIQEACEAFLEDAKARGLQDATLYKYTHLFRQLRIFAEAKGLVFISDLGVDEVRSFRASWPNTNVAARKKFEHFKAFLNFCVGSEWLDGSPAARLKPPHIRSTPTLPFSREEFARLVATCERYPDKKAAVRLRGLVLLLRYSGLRLTDAGTLRRDRIVDGKLFLYTAKTGVPVWLPLPPETLAALAAVPANGTPYYFWSGVSNKHSLARTILWRPLRKLFKLAGVEGGHAHRFRDTFAVELLLAGVPIERVSMLLGHQSVRITEKHYAPWIKARQDQLEEDVRKSWKTSIKP